MDLVGEEQGSWSGSALVARGTDVVQEISAGSTGGAVPQPCTRGTRFQAGSVSKQVMAVVVLALADRGVLALDRPIADWLADLVELAPQVTCPSLHHLGDSDSFIDADAQARVREAVTAHGAEWHTHPGADHAFDNNIGPWHHPQAAVNAWRLTTHFLDDHLPTASVPHPDDREPPPGV